MRFEREQGVSFLAALEICHQITALLTVQSQMDGEKLWQHKIDEDLEEKSQLGS